VDFADEPVREREALTQTPQAVLQCRDVVGDLDHIADRHARRFLQLEEEEVRQRGLCALDLGGKHGFLAHIRVEEEVLVRQETRHAIETAEGEQGAVQPFVQPSFESKRRSWRKRAGQERPNRFAACRGVLVLASRLPPHPASRLKGL
jgi:hypothetical protein